MLVGFSAIGRLFLRETTSSLNLDPRSGHAQDSGTVSASKPFKAVVFGEAQGEMGVCVCLYGCRDFRLYATLFS